MYDDIFMARVRDIHAGYEHEADRSRLASLARETRRIEAAHAIGPVDADIRTGLRTFLGLPGRLTGHDPRRDVTPASGRTA